MKLEKLVGDRFKERPADCQGRQPRTYDPWWLHEECGKRNLLFLYATPQNYKKDRADHP